MKKLKFISLFMVVVTVLLLQSCNERDNYMDGATVLDIVETVSINGKIAEVDHLSGRIDISLTGNTNLNSVTFEATIPNGVTISPESGTTLDLTSPVEVVVSNGETERFYIIYAKLLPTKIAFIGDGSIINEISDDDAKEAAFWAEATFGDDFVYIPFDQLTDESLETVNVVFYVHDQVGSSNQPAALLEKLNVLSKFFVQGGKIVAGQHGVGIVEELGRDLSGLKTIVGTGAGGDNPDIWAVGFTNSSVSSILTNGVTFNSSGNINVIDSGYKEDHNCMWSLDSMDAPKYANFSSMYNAEVLATWDHNLASQGSGGIILWNPSGRFKGYIITLGIGGMEWSMNDGRTNTYASNIRTIYKNSIDYLSSK